MNAGCSEGRGNTSDAREGRGRVHAGAFVLGLLLLIVGSAQAQEGLDVEEVFWCEEPESEEQLTMEECVEARELILFECTACHTVAPIVTAQNTPEEWDATFDAHADRLTELEDEEVELIRRFVVSHYNPDEEVPELPEALQDQGSNQAF